MKFTAILLLTTAALAAAVPTNLQSNIEVSQHQSDAGSLIFQRGPGDNFDMKKKCKDIWHSDKTKHRDACAGQSDEDSRNACMLRSLIGDASEKCKAAMVKALGF